MTMLSFDLQVCLDLQPIQTIEVMVWTSSIYDYFIIRPSSVTLTLNLPKQMFQVALLLLKETTLKSMHKCRSYGLVKFNLGPFYHLTRKCDLDLQPTHTNVSNGTTTPQAKHLYKITKYSQTCLKGSPKGRTKSGCLRQVTP